MANVVGHSGAWTAIVRELSLHGHEVRDPSELSPLAERLVAQRETVLAEQRSAVVARVAALSAERSGIESKAGLWARVTRRSRLMKLEMRVKSVYRDGQAYAQRYDRVMSRVQVLANSGERAGAETELRVMEWLSDLPSGYTVFNDVRLQLDRSIRIDGAWSKSAQVDHVVLGPRAVFVIETKCWSASFAQQGHYHNPYDQIGRAGKLCWIMLKDRVGQVRVVDVIVAAGALPAAPDGRHAHVVRPSEVAGFVAGYRGPMLPDACREQLDAFFRTRTRATAL